MNFDLYINTFSTNLNNPPTLFTLHPLISPSFSIIQYSSSSPLDSPFGLYYSTVINHHHQPPSKPHNNSQDSIFPMIGGDASSSSSLMREYRKGNWSFQETMVLIEAKRMDDERRQMKKHHHLQIQSQGSMMMMMTAIGGVKGKQPTELRWKWVEDYCWSKGCYRSQNQCNDKWDNLMRDYKRVRDYQKRIGEEDEKRVTSASSSSTLKEKCYWKMEKSERKEKHLPTNMSPQIYEALVEVVERISFPAPAPDFGVPMLQSSAPVTEVGLPLPLTVTPPPETQPEVELSLPVGHIADPDFSREDLDLSQPKRRKTSQEGVQDVLVHIQELEQQQQEQQQQDEELGRATTSGDHESPPLIPTTSSSMPEAISSAISASSTAVVEAIRASREEDERRHIEMMRLQERMLEIDKSKLEMSRAMVDAINNLASSIFSLANSHKP